MRHRMLAAAGLLLAVIAPADAADVDALLRLEQYRAPAPAATEPTPALATQPADAADADASGAAGDGGLLAYG